MTENLWAVVIGGLIAIVSGALGPTIQHFLTKTTAEEERLRKDKRDLAEAVGHLRDWLDRNQKHILFGEERPIELSPQSLIEAIVYTSFPNAVTPMLELNVAIAAHQKWLVGKAQLRLNGKLDVEGYEDVYGPMSLALSNVIAGALGKQLTTEADIVALEQAKKSTSAAKSQTSQTAETPKT